MLRDKKTKKVLIISLDAFRYDYLKQTRFLKDLTSECEYGRLKTIFGYTGIGAAINTGKYPKDSSVWLEFFYSPQDSPFKFFKYFSFLDFGFIRLIINLFFNFSRYFRGGSYLTSIKCIPLNKISNFNTTLYKDWGDKDVLKKNGVRTLFDVLREKNIRFLYYDWPIRATNDSLSLDWKTRNNDSDKINKLLKDRDKADLFWLRIWDLDSISHKFGPNSIEVKKYVQIIDSLCQKVCNIFKSNYDLRFLFWSDHGMLEVKEAVNFEKIIRDIEYPYFLDSTMARFWPLNKKDEHKLIEELNLLKGGRVMQREDFEKYNLDFNDQRYGKVIFIANPGNVIFPNFYNSRLPKGMHGYNPDLPEQKGIYIDSFNRERKDKEMTEMYNLILDLINNEK